MSTPEHVTGSTTIRVRYSECDPMGVVHHSVYPIWFEIGRTELLRSMSERSYRDMEAEGLFLVVAQLDIRYRSPARYDDALDLTTHIHDVGKAKITHEYSLKRDSQLIATGHTTLACVNSQGSISPIPEWLLKTASL